MNDGFGWVLVLAWLGVGCAASHAPVDCADAELRLRDLSCVEGYGHADGAGPDGTSSQFAAVCAVIDPACVVAAQSCTEARACRR